MAPWNVGFNFLQQWKPKQDHDDNNDSDEKAIAHPPSETFEMVWTTAFDPKKSEDQIFKFEIGKSISFPSKWKFILRPVHLRPSTFVAVFASLDEVGNKKYDDVVTRVKKHDDDDDDQASSSSKKTCLEIPVSLYIQLLSPEHRDVQVTIVETKLDFGQGPCFGVNRLVDVNKLHPFRFPKEDGQLKLKFKFTLFSPITKPWTKIEARDLTKEELKEQALINCDDNIQKQLRNRQLSDAIVLTSDGHRLHVHRIALLRSPYFAELLSKTKSTEVFTGKPVMNVNKSMEIMKIIMCHIHFGQLSDQLLDTQEYTPPFIKELAETAAEYGLKDLKTFLVEYYPGLKEALPIPIEAGCTAMEL